MRPPTIQLDARTADPATDSLADHPRHGDQLRVTIKGLTSHQVDRLSAAFPEGAANVAREAGLLSAEVDLTDGAAKPLERASSSGANPESGLFEVDLRIGGRWADVAAVRVQLPQHGLRLEWASPNTSRSAESAS